jgi:hypothetical protein
VSVSIDTLEHVADQCKFINESIRVANKASIHYFLYGKYAHSIELFKKSLGHIHNYTPISESVFKTINHKFSLTPFLSASEHLLLMATINNNLNIPELFDFANSFTKDDYYGYTLEVIK